MNRSIYKKTVNVLLSKRFSIDEKQIFLIGSIAEFINSRDYFKSNISIREYAQYYFDSVGEPLGDYLIANRTLLIARISKIILANDDFNDIVTLISYHMSYLERIMGTSSNIEQSEKYKKSILDSLLNDAKEFKNDNKKNITR